MTTITMMMTTTTIEMMTMTKHANRNGRQSSTDKIWAVGLAGVTCAGLVGVVGVRVAQDAAASTVDVEPDSASLEYSEDDALAVSSSGLTEAQLDQYAGALATEAARLEAYHAELLEVAARLQESADALNAAQQVVPASSSSNPGKASDSGKSSTAQGPTKPAPAAKPARPAKPAPAAKPVPKPAAAPQVAAPQAKTRGS